MNAPRKQWFTILVLALATLVTLRSSSASAQPATRPTTAPTASRASLPYCGVYSLLAAAESLDHPIPERSLVKEAYISSPTGSTAANLVLAAREHGLTVSARSGLTSADLRRLGGPVILHTLANDVSQNFDHWVAYLGHDGQGNAIVFDPYRPDQRLVSFAELVPTWDGVGLLVSRETLPLASRLPGTDPVSVVDFAVLVGSCLVLRWAGRPRDATPATPGPRRRSPLRSIARLAGVMAVAGAAALTQHSLSAEGFLASARPTHRVRQASVASTLPELSVGDVREEVAGGDVVLIDARFADDYAYGHIDGARSVPYHLPSEARRRLMADVPKNARVVLYCQSGSCDFDEQLAALLLRDRYESLSLYNGGWQEWRDAAERHDGATHDHK